MRASRPATGGSTTPSTLEGDGTREQYEEIHQAVMATSPNYFNMAQPIQMCGRLA